MDGTLIERHCYDFAGSEVAAEAGHLAEPACYTTFAATFASGATTGRAVRTAYASVVGALDDPFDLLR